MDLNGDNHAHHIINMVKLASAFDYKGYFMSQFEEWFVAQDFYTNMRFIHGDALFLRDGDVYRVLPVQMTYTAHKLQQAEKVRLEKQIEGESQ